MPVKLSNDLVVDSSNRLTLDYHTLYNKLNKAIAWTSESNSTVYTVDYVDDGYNVYSSPTNSTPTGTITYIMDDTITVSSVVYTRDTSKDSNFSFIPSEAETKTITVKELLAKIDA